MFDLSSVIDWIENHERTVDLLKWIAALFAAWSVGIFRYLRRMFKLPSSDIVPNTGICFLEDFENFRGYKNAVRASFVVEISLTNPTNLKVAIKSFELQYERIHPWKRWGKVLLPITLPSRPRVKMAEKEKLLKTWFSNYGDGLDNLSIQSEIESTQHQTAFLLFVGFSGGSESPRIRKNKILIKTVVELTSGQKCKAKGTLRILRDQQQADDFVPGLSKQVAHSSSWGAYKSH